MNYETLHVNLQESMNQTSTKRTIEHLGFLYKSLTQDNLDFALLEALESCTLPWVVAAEEVSMFE